MKRKTTYFLISIFLMTPFFYFIPITTVHGQDADEMFIQGTLQSFISFDPLIGEGGISGQTRGWCYEPLYKIESTDPDHESFYMVPWLVESENIFDGGIKVNLTIRQGIKFWNGKELNASVVKWNLDRQRDVGQSFYGQYGTIPYQAIIQWTWHSIDTFLAIPGNEDYNNSALYPDLWWNKDDSRYPPEYWDGTNQTAAKDLVWPRDIGNWTGRSVWNDEPIWIYNTTTKDDYYDGYRWEPGSPVPGSGNAPSGERNSNVYNNVTLYPGEPYKLTVNLFFPAFPFWKSSSMYTMGLVYPDGTYNPSTDIFEPTGPMYYPGDGANPDYKQKYLSVKGPNYDRLQTLQEAVDRCIGTGPFILEEYNEADQWFRMSRNDDYWGGNWLDTNRDGPIMPNMTEVICQRYDTTEAMYAALLDGELDFAIMEGQWTDYENQIRKKASLNLSDMYPVGGEYDIRFNLKEVDKTLRYAMSFAFNLEHYSDPDIWGDYVIPGKGPFWDALYTDYTTNELHPKMTHDGSGTEVGFYYNITEARWWLLHNDSLNGNRATARGLDDDSTTEVWRDVALSGDPIFTISHLDHADFPHWYNNFKTYMADIGIAVEKYGPIASADYYPYELMEHRWNPGGTAAKQSWLNSFIFTSPNLFNQIKWHLDDILGIGDVLDPLDNFAIWNSWPYLPSTMNVTSDWAVSQGYTTYEPTIDNMRQLIHALPFLSDDTQIMLDYGTIMDKTYRDAISIWLFKPTGFQTLHSTWDWGGRKPSEAFGYSIFDFRQTGWSPEEAIIPGYSTGLLIGISILTIIGIAVVALKKKR